MEPKQSDTSILVAKHNKIPVVFFCSLYSYVFLGGLAGVAAALFDASSNLGLRIFAGLMGILGIIWFGWWGGWYLTILFRKEPALLVSRDGIYDNTEPWSLGLIKWSEITYIYKPSHPLSRVVILQLNDRAAIVKRQRNPLKRLLYKKGMFFKSETEINIRINTITKPVLGQLLQRIQDTEQKKLQFPDDSEA